MLITKEQQEALVDKYIKEKHNHDECIGFINGLNAMLELISKIEQNSIEPPNRNKMEEKIERIKQLNEVRKFFKAQETEFYDWNEPEKYQEKRKQRKKIEKEIFNLIQEL